MEPEGSLTC